MNSDRFRRGFLRSPFIAAVFSLTLAACPLVLMIGGCSSHGSADKAEGKEAGKADEGKPDESKGEEKAGGEKAEDSAVPTVAVATARLGRIEQTITVTGILAIPREQQATLASPVAGVIDSFPVRLGDAVQRGQVVAHLSTRTLAGQIEQARATVGQYDVQVQQAEANALQQRGQSQAAVLQAQAAVANARGTLLAAQATLSGAQATLTGNEASLVNARENLTRLQTLFNDGLVARKDVEAAELAVRTAEAQVAAQQQTVAAQQQTVAAQKQTIAGLQQAVQAASLARLQDVVKQKDVAVARQQLENARGALRTAEAQAGLYTIVSPITGVVTSVGASVGEAVDTTRTVLTIANLDRLQLQLAVPTYAAGKVHIGQPVVFSVDILPGRTFRARIDTLGRQVDPNTSTINAIAMVNNPLHLLRDNMTARAGIVTAAHPGVVLVPRAAVFFDADAAGTTARVLKIGTDDTVHYAPVKTGFADDTTIEIVSGVSAGDRLATTGGFGLADGTKVQVPDGGGSVKKAEESGDRPATANGKGAER